MARTRVNVKFLIGLVAVVAVVAVAGVFLGYVWKDNPDRAIARAQAAEETGEWVTARTQWGKAASLLPDRPDLRLNYVKAQLHLLGDATNGQANYLSARSVLTGLLESHPTFVPGMKLLLELQQAEGSTRVTDLERTRDLARRIIELEPDDREARVALAEATLQLDENPAYEIPDAEVDAAVADLRQLDELTPGAGGAMSLVGRHDLVTASREASAGRLDEAQAKLDEAVTFVNQSVARGEGENLPRLKQRAFGVLNAAAGVQRAIDLRRQGADLRSASDIEWSDAALALREQAMTYIREAAETVPADNEHAVEIKLTYAQAQQQIDPSADSPKEEGTADGNTGALATLGSLYEEHPDRRVVALSYSRALERAGQIDEAIDVIAKEFPKTNNLYGPPALMELRFEPEIPLRLAQLRLRKLDRTTDAEERQKIVVAARDAYNQFLARKGDMPETPGVLKVRGQLEFAEGKAAAALNTLESVVQQLGDAAMRGGSDRQTYVESLFYLARANQALRQTGAARAYLTQVVEAAPEFLPARQSLVQLLISDGLAEQARPHAKALVDADPDNPVFQSYYQQTLPTEQREADYAQLPEETNQQQRVKLSRAVSLNKQDEVLRLGRQLLAETPEDRGVALIVAQVLSRQGEKEEALKLAEAYAGDDPAVALFVAQLRGENLSESVDEVFEDDESRRLYAQFQIAAREGRSDEALQLLRDAVKARPDSTRLQELLFENLLARRQFDEARKSLEALANANADNLDGRSYEVQLALAENRTNDAIDLGRRLVADYPGVSRAFLLLANAHLAGGRLADARDNFSRALQMSPSDPNALRGIVQAMDGQNNLEAARPFIDRGLAVRPNDTFFRNADLLWQLRFGDPQALVDAKRKAVEENPENLTALLDLARTYVQASGAVKSKDPARAREYLESALQTFQKGVEQFPDDLQMAGGLADVARLVEKPELGKAALEAIASRDAYRTNPEAATLLAAWHQSQNDLLGAESAVRRYLANDPSNITMLGRLAGLLAAQQRYDDAEKILRSQDDPRLKTALVELQIRRGDFAAAKQLSEQALSQPDPQADQLALAAFTEINLRNWEAANSILDRLERKAPDDFRLHFYRALIEVSRPDGSLQTAQNELERVLRQRPDNIDALRLLARIERQRGLRDQAIAHLQQLLELTPRDVDQRLALLDLYATSIPPRYSRADELFAEADELGLGNDPRLLSARSDLAQRRGRTDDAIRYAEQALQASNNNNQFLASLLDKLLAANRAQDVIQRTEPMVSNASNPGPWWIYRARGLAFDRLRRREAAVASFGQAVAQLRQIGGADAADSVLLQMAREIDFDAAYALVADRVDEDPRARISAAKLYSANDKPAEARAMLENALTGDLDQRQKLQTLIQLGTSYMTDLPKDYDKAITAFERALELDPNHLAALNNIAYALTLHQTDAAYARATEYAKRAYDASRQPDGSIDPLIGDTYGWALVLTGQAQEGVQILRQARQAAEETNRQFPEVYLHLAEGYLKLKQPQAAAEAAETGLALLQRQEASGEKIDALVQTRLRDALGQARQARSVQAAASGADQRP